MFKLSKNIKCKAFYVQQKILINEENYIDLSQQQKQTTRENSFKSEKILITLD